MFKQHHNELFIISREAWEALSEEEVEATVEGLKVVQAYGLPYPKIDILVGVDYAVRWIDKAGATTQRPPLGPEVVLLFEGVSLESPPEVVAIHDKKFGTYYPVAHRGFDETKVAMRLANMLITLLATKNVVKDRNENKPPKPGHGRTNVVRGYRYVTTLRPPRTADMEDDIEHKPTGRTNRPHLRRGHVRGQRYGKGFEFVKSIWIAPVFVNADPSFMSTRTAYNL
jgi:hypothetical protein